MRTGSPGGMGSELHLESVRSCHACIKLRHHGATGTELQVAVCGKNENPNNSTSVRRGDVDGS